MYIANGKETQDENNTDSKTEKMFPIIAQGHRENIKDIQATQQDDTSLKETEANTFNINTTARSTKQTQKGVL